MRKRVGIVLAVVLALGSAVRAAPPPGVSSWKTGAEPLQVDAKSMTYLSKDNLIIFEGEVVAHQGEMTLHGDRVEVRVEEKTQEIRRVHATGNVRILKEDMVATGDVADYEALTGIAVLTGHPKVWKGKDVVVGDKITVYLADNRSVVEGTVKAVIFPPAKKTEAERK